MYIRMNKKTVISLILCLGVLLMAVGYSVLSSNLNITGGASITTTWDIRITSITHSATGSAYNVDDYTYTNDTAKFKVALVNPGDAMTYTIKVENKGTITAVLNTLDITQSGTSQIIYEVTGVKQGDTIAAGSSKNITVVARYNSNATDAPVDAVKSLSVGLTWIQYANQSISAGTYTINYNANGGSGTMSGTTCTVGSNCTLRSNTFTNSGKSFKGWSTEKTGAHVYTNGQTVMNLTSSGKTVTLYAIWGEVPKSITTAINSSWTAYRDTTESTYAPDGIDFDDESSDTNGKGLYYTSSNTEDGGTTYYFRGEVNNNYVQLGTHSSNATIYRGYYNNNGTVNYNIFYDFTSLSECEASSSVTGCTAIGAKAGTPILWRIVRINEDGSIRLITEYPIGYSAFNTSEGDNAYVGYMYGTVGASSYSATHTNTNSSTIKTLIDNWYAATLTSFTSMISPTAGFCNDRTLATETHSTNGTGYGTSSTYYGAYDRVYDYSSYGDPQFACPNKTRDLLLYKSSSATGAKVLNYPIGLLSADEANYAGVPDKGNSSTYYLASGGQTWTMSPRNTGRMMYAGGYESNTTDLASSKGVRPVINMMDFCVTGSGTATDPYVYDADCA